MGGGLGDFRHESHENPGTELAELPTMETLCRRAASVCPGGGALESLWRLERGYKTRFGLKLRFFSMDRRTPLPPETLVDQEFVTHQIQRVCHSRENQQRAPGHSRGRRHQQLRLLGWTSDQCVFGHRTASLNPAVPLAPRALKIGVLGKGQTDASAVQAMVGGGVGALR